MEKQKGAAITRALRDDRKSQPVIFVVEETDTTADAEEFWKALGGRGTIKTAEQGGMDDEEAKLEKANAGIRRLMHLSDASGKMEFKLVAEGNAIKKSQFISDDVMVFDSGTEVYCWVGKGASPDEKKKGLGYAQEYLKQYNRPAHIPICRISEGGEPEPFKVALQ